jgi:hypothetical protein
MVISTAKFPPLRIAACGSELLFLTGLKTGHYKSLQSSLLAGSLPAVISCR